VNSITSSTLIVTKLDSGNLKFQFQNDNGGLQYQFILNPGHLQTIYNEIRQAGDSREFYYGQDANKLDYDSHYQGSGGN
jgi:hypothetical protein